MEVFISYNRAERDVVEPIVQRLEGRGVELWFDRNLEAGSRFRGEIAAAIEKARVAVVFVGPHGVGPFQTIEIDACEDEALRRGLRVIPVPLPDGRDRVPLFLRNRQWVDMSGGVDDEGIVTLERAIAGAMAADVATRVIEVRTRGDVAQQLDRQHVDPLGIALRKGRLLAISEVIADAASDAAANAAHTYDSDGLSVFVPLLVGMRWRRGWGAAVDRLLKVPASRRLVRDFRCAAVESCPVAEGTLHAAGGAAAAVVISLDGHAAVTVSQLDPSRRADIVASVNAYGRLGASPGSLLERIGDVPVRSAGDDDPDARMLFDAREALVPILARLRRPGDEWLWGERDADETPLPGEAARDESTLQELRERARREATGDPEVFRATREVRFTAAERELLLLPAVRTLFGSLVDTDPGQVIEHLRRLRRTDEDDSRPHVGLD